MTIRIFDTEYKLILIIYIINKDKLFFNKKFKHKKKKKKHFLLYISCEETPANYLLFILF